MGYLNANGSHAHERPLAQSGVVDHRTSTTPGHYGNGSRTHTHSQQGVLIGTARSRPAVAPCCRRRVARPHAAPAWTPLPARPAREAPLPRPPCPLAGSRSSVGAQQRSGAGGRGTESVGVSMYEHALPRHTACVASTSGDDKARHTRLRIEAALKPAACRHQTAWPKPLLLCRTASQGKGLDYVRYENGMSGSSTTTLQDPAILYSPGGPPGRSPRCHVPRAVCHVPQAAAKESGKVRNGCHTCQKPCVA